MKTIKEQWESFESLVVPKDASNSQRKELEGAFYSGALGLYINFTELGMNEVTEEEGIIKLEEYEDDLKEFFKLVGVDLPIGRG